MLAVAGLLFLLNPVLNQGPLFFVQKRMGFGCRPFMAVKFRTMTAATVGARGAFDALEHDRITPLGHILRKARLDELPQIINVLRGEMSLIGPRPDAYEFAQVYLREIPGYRARHQVMPGITGLAQVEVGYVEGRSAVASKVAADLRYVKTGSFALDLWIAWRTLLVVVQRKGA